MCGLTGILARPRADPDVLEATVAGMAERLRHRGPDDAGSWVEPEGRVAFGFRRLSIQDLSVTGRQPMDSPSGRYTMVFNGEVYNFRTLRKDLVREGLHFRGGSDSEVLVGAFERWGVEKTLDQLIGMFAIALWDRERTELTLIRDRLGIKPLYVARTAMGLAFGSELRVIMASPGFNSALDVEALGNYLRYLFIPAPRTPFKNAWKVPPGHLLRVPSGTLGGLDSTPDFEPFWSVPEARAKPLVSRDVERATDQLEEILSDAVALRMIADVPVGALLSGGVDSSLVTALMSLHSSEAPRTFTIGFDAPEHDESAHASAVAAHLGTRHTELHVTGKDALDLVPSIPRIFDEPLGDPSQIPTHLVSRLARRDVTVALSGDGGDELFAGYNRYISGRTLIDRAARVPRISRRFLAAAIRSVPAVAWEGVSRSSGGVGGPGRIRLPMKKAAKLSQMLGEGSPADMYRSLLSTGNGVERHLRRCDRSADPLRHALRELGSPLELSDMLEIDQRFYLPDDLLQKADRASMAVGLEMRVPLLDHRVVEFSWGLPDDLKIRGNVGKWILRQVLYRHVPAKLVDRPKTGFSIPVEDWLGGPLRGWAEELLLGSDTFRDGLFDPETVRSAWQDFSSGRSDRALELWAILMLEAWRREWNVTDMQGAG